ncbi:MULTISPECIES: PAS domain-containing protein [unclassified Yoonia]|uniref:PAS domain-containing protein n=1 Tax=unclassified Yoonia TaxID=2629118 RepID=UPI002AFDE1D9|nr:MULTISPECIES: PAS domain-containing protein [unclassified Yoonia]
MSPTRDHPENGRDSLPGADCPILRSLEAYWQSLRHARRIPARNDIAPDQIDAALPYAFVLQRVAPGVARMRVAGQRIHDLLRMDARGMPVSILFAPGSRDALSDLVETAFVRPAIIAADLIAPAQLFHPALAGRIMLLPLRDDQGKTSRVLGALVTKPVTGNAPRRFDLAPGRTLRIDSLAIGLVSSQPSPQQKPDAIRPALRLIVNNA